jgi:hypothetical protein
MIDPEMRVKIRRYFYAEHWNPLATSSRGCRRACTLLSESTHNLRLRPLSLLAKPHQYGRFRQSATHLELLLVLTFRSVYELKLRSSPHLKKLDVG